MWSQIVLAFFVAVASASPNPGWKENTEYVYQVRGRTLTSLHDVSDDYSGVLLKAKLTIRSQSDGTLQGKIAEPQYAQVHAELSDGWQEDIPQSQLSYQPLPVSTRPFQIVMENGVIRDLVVSKDISNWEANFVKGIVSQFQLDTNAENLIDSHINALPQESRNQNSAVYKTMEDTVTGISETLYEIHPLPDYVLLSQPWLAPFHHLKGDGDVIEIVKNKNYNHSEERPAYHYGFHGMGPDFEPAENSMGRFFTRTSVSRAVITGKLSRYTMQNSYTTEEIMMSPILSSDKQGSVNSILNVTLVSIGGQNGQNEEIQNPISLGSLVYRYNLPFAKDNKVRPGQNYQGPRSGLDSEESQEQSDEARNSNESNQDDDDWEPQQQPSPRLNEAPQSPLLPFTVGYQGQSIKQKENIVQLVQKLAHQIGEELSKPSQIQHQDTGDKFVTLVALVRVMDEREVQQAASALYSKGSGAQRQAWIAFSSSVYESGTGPGLLAIQDWIKSGKIEEGEAADAVATAAHSARQPTEEYIRSFYQMIRTPEIMNQNQLNESALLAFTKLVHHVYVDQDTQHSEFPVHSFGSFRTKQGVNFMKNEVIPHLKKKLDQAIEEADTEDIHAYIRALGNVGHQQILPAFEPYLEGKKQASQFQRLLMVVALDKLAQVKPKLARSVLYKIYQNPAEHDQVRVAAVYQLMRTEPPKELLQRMAAATKIETNKQVNAAVKSAIETIADLDNEEFATLRDAAQAASELLTDEDFGAQYAREQLNDYVNDEMDFALKQAAQTFGSDDSFMPDGLRYSLRTNVGGIRRRLAVAQAMVSSIDDLTNVLLQQTDKYRQQQKEKQQNNPEKMPWSSENIAKLLKMQNDDDEQLEGSFYMELLSLQKILSFDNDTIDRLPQAVRSVEQSLKKGKSFKHTSMSIASEISINFPTELGFPFFYNLDTPIMYNAEGKIQGEAQPQVGSENYLKTPNSVQAEFQVRLLVAAKSRTQLGFITPFDSKRYSAGYDQNYQLYAPLQGKIHVDVQKQQVKLDLEGLDSNKDTELLHYSTWPYTAKENIFTTEHQRQIIKEKHQPKIDMTFGQKSTGIALKLKASADRPMDLQELGRNLLTADGPSDLLDAWDESRRDIQQSQLTLSVAPQQSSTKRVSITFGYQSKYQSSKQESSNDSQDGADVKQLKQITSESATERQNEFMRRASGGIHNAHSYAMDALVEFQGAQIKYRLTAAAAKSNVDPKSRLLFHMIKTGNSNSYEVAVAAKSHAPNTNGLDLTYAMEFDPTSTLEIQSYIGENYQNAAKFDMKVQARQSEERKQHLKRDPMYKECQKQMQNGNHQLPECANITIRANLLDRVDISIDYRNMLEEAMKKYAEWANIFSHVVFAKLNQSSNANAGTNKDQVQIQAKFNPELDAVNVTIESKKTEYHINNMEVGDWARQIFVSHPVFHVKTRLIGNALGYNSYRPVCVVDKTAASTFDDKTYPVKLSQDWTVMLMYVPSRPQDSDDDDYDNQNQGHGSQYGNSNSNSNSNSNDVYEQLKDEVENYAVYVRADKSGSSQKEVKITYQSPSSQGQYVDVTIKPTGSKQYPKVYVNGQETKYSKQQAADKFNGNLQIYGLPNEEVKVELSDGFYVIYDGIRVKLTVVDGKFRQSVRGICGAFRGEEETSFESAQGCILDDPEEFVASYTVNQQQDQRISELKARSQKGNCVQKDDVMYVNVISDRDAGRSQNPQGSHHSSMCTRHQTRYVTENGQVCFTLIPVPVCRSQCQQQGTVSKNIPVHCVEDGAASRVWTSKIDQGANPILTHKSETKKVKMDLPQRCSA